MNRDPDERAHPEGGRTPDEFDAIVAAWQSEGRVPRWPDDGRSIARPAPDDPLAGLPLADAPLAEAPRADAVPPSPPSGISPVRPYPAPPPDEEHFVPPEPPPLPRLGPPVIVGLVLLGLGLLLLAAPGWLGVPERFGLPLGLVVLAAGIGWLVLRLWPESPSGDGDRDGDGAVL